MDTLETFAIHEAGHAVAGHFSILGQFPCTAVELDPPPGRTKWVPTTYDRLPSTFPAIDAALETVLAEMKQLRLQGQPVVISARTLQDPAARAVAQRLRFLMVCLAGDMAQGRHDENVDHDNYWGDHKEVEKLKRELFGLDRMYRDPLMSKTVAECRAVVEQSLEQHWNAVKALATELERTLHVTGDDVVRIIQSNP